MLVAAAVCPCPPLLVPEVAAGAAPELDGLRAACADAVGVLAAARPDRLVVVGPGARPGPAVHPAGTPGSFRPFGVPLDVRLGAAAAPPGDAEPLPSALAVAAWLLRGWGAAPVEGLAVGEGLAPERCAAAGRAAADSVGRLAMLVMGDGSACRSPKAPGYLDGRAEPFDSAVAKALGSADTAALAALDPGLARQVKAAGRAPWQVLAAAGAPAGLSGRLLYDAAPYGVGYVTAVWS
jgi:hypothetical protein